MKLVLAWVGVALAAATPRELVLSSLNFLHTTDTHGWLGGHLHQPVYTADWGDFVLLVAHMRTRVAHHGGDLLVVDTGDRHDGNGLLDATAVNGEITTPIWAATDYDLVTLGNHELYVAENTEQEHRVAQALGERYVLLNVEFVHANGTVAPFANRFRYFATPNTGTRVLALLFLFDFPRANPRAKVTPLAQVVVLDWFQQLVAQYGDSGSQTVDVLVVYGHLPVSHGWSEMRVLHQALRRHFDTTPIQYLGGHSHIRDFTVWDARSSALQSGRFCETVGFVLVDLEAARSATNAREVFARSYIDFSRDSFEFHAKADTFDTREGTAVSNKLARARTALGLDKVVGWVNHTYYTDYAPYPSSRSLFSLLADEVLPQLPGRTGRIVIINTGSIRYDLYKGPYTVDTNYIVLPFQNDWSVIAGVDVAVANRVEEVLNNRSVIALRDVDLRLLAPPHQRDSTRVEIIPDGRGTQERFDTNSHLQHGYVTHDDFGATGDDTPHRGWTQYPVPNVVAAYDGSGPTVDLVFYDFITPYVVWALDTLTGNGGAFGVEHYGNVTVQQLLQQWAQ